MDIKIPHGTCRLSTKGVIFRHLGNIKIHPSHGVYACAYLPVGLDCEVIMKILQRGAFFSNREVVLLLLASPFGEVESTERQPLDYTQEYTEIHRNT